MLAYYFDLALRSLKRTPLVSGLMMLALAAGVGLTITMLSVYLQLKNNDADKLTVMPYAVQFQTQNEGHGGSLGGAFRQVTYQDALAVSRSDTLAETLMMFRVVFAVSTDNKQQDPQIERTRVTNKTFFSMFELEFTEGTSWSNAVESDGGYEAVIATSLAKELFGNTPAIGKAVNLDGKPYRVVGVVKDYAPAPAFYDLNNDIFHYERIYIPMSLTPIEKFENISGNTNGWKGERINSYEERLASELLWIQSWVSFKDQSEQQEFIQWGQDYIAEQKKIGRFNREQPKMFLRTPQEWLELFAVVPEEATILLAISVLFLLICIINTIGLLLGKFIKNAPAVGTRRALGASQQHIFMQHIVEVSVIGIVGSFAGLLMAWLVLGQLDQILNTADAVNYSVTKMHWAMWVYAPAIAIASAILAGVIPAWRICRMPPSLYLKVQ